MGANVDPRRKRSTIECNLKRIDFPESNTEAADTIKKLLAIHGFSWVIYYTIGPILTQSDLSVENGLFRLKPKSGFLTIHSRKIVQKELFRLDFFRLRFWTGRSSRKSLPVQKLSRKSFASVLTCRIARAPPNTLPHAHTPIPGTTQQHRTTAPKLGRLSLLLLPVASQRGALLAPLASSVYHTTAAARGLDAILPTTATPAASLAALG